LKAAFLLVVLHIEREKALVSSLTIWIKQARKSLLNPCRSVPQYGFHYDFMQLRVSINFNSIYKVFKLLPHRLGHFKGCIIPICRDNSHLIASESSSLVGADVGSTSHSLTGYKLPHQVIFFEHLLAGETK
jgi:hypothetical protein